MSCERIESMIALDAGGDLPAAEARRLGRHLESCGACRRFAAEMRDSQRAVALLADAPVDSEVLDSIRAGVLHEVERDDRRRGPIPFRLPPRALALAAAVVVALGALLLLRAGEPELGEPETVEAPRVAEAIPAPEPPTEEPIFAEPVTPNPSAIEETASEAPIPSPPVTVSRETRVATAQLPTPPAALPAITAPIPDTPVPEPMFIKLVSEEADLVIYWLIQTPAEATKETTHEVSAV